MCLSRWMKRGCVLCPAVDGHDFKRGMLTKMTLETFLKSETAIRKRRYRIARDGVLSGSLNAYPQKPRSAPSPPATNGDQRCDRSAESCGAKEHAEHTAGFLSRNDPFVLEVYFIFTNSAPCGATVMENSSANLPKSFCRHKSRTGCCPESFKSDHLAVTFAGSWLRL
jgi:hypothetical protein